MGAAASLHDERLSALRQRLQVEQESRAARDARAVDDFERVQLLARESARRRRRDQRTQPGGTLRRREHTLRLGGGEGGGAPARAPR